MTTEKRESYFIVRTFLVLSLQPFLAHSLLLYFFPFVSSLPFNILPLLVPGLRAANFPLRPRGEEAQRKVPFSNSFGAPAGYRLLAKDIFRLSRPSIPTALASPALHCLLGSFN